MKRHKKDNRRRNNRRHRRLGIEPLEDRCLLASDFGDAPDSYHTILATDGARHEATGVTLGATRDAESDAATPLNGTGDDATNTGSADDEDGVVVGAFQGTQGPLSDPPFPPSVQPGYLPTAYSDPALKEGRASVTINGGLGLARLYGWVDFNRDGDFADANEQIADGSTALADGVHNIDFDVPSTPAMEGATFARFRVSTETGLSFDGPASDGEVEDYPLSIAVTNENNADESREKPVDVWFGTVTAPSGLTVSQPDFTFFSTPVSQQAADAIEGDAAIDARVRAAADSFVYTAGQSFGNRPVSDAEQALRDAFASALASLQAQTASPLQSAFIGPTTTAIPDIVDGTTVEISTVPVGTPPFLVNAFFVNVTNADGVTLHELNFTVTQPLDFGDAPDSYHTLLATDGARHEATGVMLGSTRDAEADAATPLNGTGDDVTNTGSADDEDGVVVGACQCVTGPSSSPGIVDAGYLPTAYSDPAIKEGRASITISGGGGLARLYGWVDFNRDGDFADADEQIADGSTTLPDGVHNIDFDVPATAVTGATFARFRVSTDTELSFDGLASDGEVEDYPLSIAVTIEHISNDAAREKPVDVWFGTVTAPSGLTVLQPDFTFFSTPISQQAADAIEGDAAIDAQVRAAADSFVYTAGQFFDNRPVSDAEQTLGDAFDAVLLDLQSQTALALQSAFDGPTTTGPQSFEDGTVIETTNFPVGSPPFLVNSFHVTVTNVDGVTLHELNFTVTLPPLDFGDAPDAEGGSAAGNPYPTLLEHDGARHVITEGPYLGTEPPDEEADGQPNANAEGDDVNGEADDEDGVVISDGFSLLIGAQATATVHISGTQEVGARLFAWIDFDGNGSFDPDEQISDGSTLLFYGDHDITFTVPDAGFAGTTYARFRLSTDEGLLPNGLASDGEVEDYLVTIVGQPACSVGGPLGIFGDPLKLGQNTLNVCNATPGNIVFVVRGTTPGNAPVVVQGVAFETNFADPRRFALSVAGPDGVAPFIVRTGADGTHQFQAFELGTNRAGDVFVFDVNVPPPNPNIPDATITTSGMHMATLPTTDADGDVTTVDATLLGPDAIAQSAYDLDQRYRFYATPGLQANNYYYNYYGLGEKYIYGSWGTYLIYPNGDLYQWGWPTPIGSLSPDYHAYPSLLTDAINPSELADAADVTVDVTIDGSNHKITVTPQNGFTGWAIVKVTVADGCYTVTDLYRVEVTPDAAPLLAAAGERTPLGLAHTDAPSEPLIETPTEPLIETPTEPLIETPTEVLVETPTEPLIETPTEPLVETATELPAETRTETRTVRRSSQSTRRMTRLNRNTLGQTIIAALEIYESAGLTTSQLEQLSQVEFAIADLDGSRLGETIGNQIVIDVSAAGHGWYIDPTPLNNQEFLLTGDTLLAAGDSAASGRMDLLTVVLHELGHVLGYDDHDSQSDSDDLMYAELATGLRKLPAG